MPSYGTPDGAPVSVSPARISREVPATTCRQLDQIRPNLSREL